MARSKMLTASDVGKHTPGSSRGGARATGSSLSGQSGGVSGVLIDKKNNALNKNMGTLAGPAVSSGVAALVSPPTATSSAETKKNGRVKGAFSPQELLQRGQNAYRESRRSLLVAQSRLCHKKWRLYIYLLQEEANEGANESSCRLQLAYRTAYRIWLVGERNLWSKQRKKFRFLLGVDQQNLFQDHDNNCEMPLVHNVQV